MRFMRIAMTLSIAGSVLAVGAPALAAEGSRFRAALSSERGMVVTNSAQAAAVGAAILKDGGNAVDAAVATAFALGVTRPDLCGIGGDGVLLYRGSDGTVASLDFTGTAPAALDANLLERLEHSDEPNMYKDRVGHLASVVPGFVAGLDEALRELGSGTISLADAIAPAEKLAREGIIVSWDLARSMFDQGVGRTMNMQLFPETARTYLVGGSAPYPPGSILLQTDYANSLRTIMESGPDAFYDGPIADAIAADMAAAESSINPVRDHRYGSDEKDIGQLTTADFENYVPLWRIPVETNYRGHRVYAMPAPIAGGVATLMMLNILEGFDLDAFGYGSADHLHAIAETQKITFSDFFHIGDPDFVTDYSEYLSSQGYASQRRDDIDMTRSGSYAKGELPTNKGTHTSHLSVIDAAGNAVALNCTMGEWFGSKVMAPGTGFVLNSNNGWDFAEGHADNPEPGKRPNRVLNPVIVERHNRLVLVTGGGGGSRIVNGVVQMIVNAIEFGMDAAHAQDAERVHAGSYGPIAFSIEDSRVAGEVLAELKRRGHTLKREGEYFDHAVLATAGFDLASGLNFGVSDPRNHWGVCAAGTSCPYTPLDALCEPAPPSVEAELGGIPSRLPC